MRQRRRKILVDRSKNRSEHDLVAILLLSKGKYHFVDEIFHRIECKLHSVVVDVIIDLGTSMQ